MGEFHPLLCLWFLSSSCLFYFVLVKDNVEERVFRGWLRHLGGGLCLELMGLGAANGNVFCFFCFQVRK